MWLTRHSDDYRQKLCELFLQMMQNPCQNKLLILNLPPYHQTSKCHMFIAVRSRLKMKLILEDYPIYSNLGKTSYLSKTQQAPGFKEW